MLMKPPFEQLERCHRRLEEACDALTRAANSRDIETASDVCGFFARQIRRHEEDEEKSLFPRLASAGEDLRGILTRLEAEHREHETLQARLEEAVAGRFQGDLWKELEAVADLLARAYRAHIELEESALFPAARTLLTADDLDAMSREMDERRGR